ncbi:phage tail assembly chaperone [Pseudoxanthomonas sacheonensis]|uniref:phage tail assembly chaperone n=1 Tax=Pseudoxanthomonas sacheonensis TaxID=443615 RepID=UPI0013D6128C|nr:phage tail assembly chaperone [Pseudoxanthomonas sacheonensis]KAF1706291.1 hypothetical protein CSC73_16435 [Pseudoxanthomonas sacheonensis]
MAKLILTAEPTFKAPVAIPVPGGKTTTVSFTFTWRTRDQAKDWMESIEKMSDEEIVLSAATGWELDDDFNAENVKALCQKFGGSARAIFNTYVDELRGAKAKN